MAISGIIVDSMIFIATGLKFIVASPSRFFCEAAGHGPWASQRHTRRRWHIPRAVFCDTHSKDLSRYSLGSDHTLTHLRLPTRAAVPAARLLPLLGLLHVHMHLDVEYAIDTDPCAHIS